MAQRKKKAKKVVVVPRLPLEGVLLLRKHRFIEDKRGKQLARCLERERRSY